MVRLTPPHCAALETAMRAFQAAERCATGSPRTNGSRASRRRVATLRSKRLRLRSAGR